MIKKKKLMSLLFTISMLVMLQVPAHAEWRQTSSGDWWYADKHGGWYVNWNFIDGKTYYFCPENGLMAHDTTIDGFTLPSNGGWEARDLPNGGIVTMPPMLRPNSFNFVYETGVIHRYKDNAEEIIIPPSFLDYKVKTIKDFAFFGNTNTKKVTISDGIEEIGECSFDNCPNLEEVYIPDSIQTIGRNAFNHSMKAKFFVRSERVKKILGDSGIVNERIIVQK